MHNHCSLLVLLSFIDLSFYKLPCSCRCKFTPTALYCYPSLQNTIQFAGKNSAQDDTSYKCPTTISVKYKILCMSSRVLNTCIIGLKVYLLKTDRYEGQLS